MTDLSADHQALASERAGRRPRFVTATALFDGHDAALHIVRRLLMAAGAEVVHLGHNRSVDEVVSAALQEDVQGIAVSSCQGGHVEYFGYLVERLRACGGAGIRVFGGGGAIVPQEIDALAAQGVRIFSPADGQRLGMAGMVDEMLTACAGAAEAEPPGGVEELRGHGEAAWRALARTLSALEDGTAPATFRRLLHEAAAGARVPVLGVTGTGGAGKSSLTDELIRRLRLDQDDALRIAVVSIDPSRRKSGGALLGDRIRMNAIAPWPRPAVGDDGRRVFMRSLATRGAGSEIGVALPDVLAACKAAGFDLVIVETSGIGQGDAAIVPHCDLPLYVMTPEFGAASQLEKIDMLDFAELVAINKFDRRGAPDALRDVAKQLQRNRAAFDRRPDEMPVFGTIASRFNDDGVTALYQALRERLGALGLPLREPRLAPVALRHSSADAPIVPAARVRYLAEIADTVRGRRRRVAAQATLAREAQQLREAARMLTLGKPEKPRAAAAALHLAQDREAALDADARALLDGWPALKADYADDALTVMVRGRELHTPLARTSLSGTRIPRVALPRWEDHGELLRWLMLENLPGRYPFTAGVFAFKHEDEEPTRMFAGEGDAFRTNRRFKVLSAGQSAQRLSTAFDAVTLYGHDPDRRPDIHGKIGNSGVSIATLDDMKALYEGFDLCDPGTSVSMTIDGPAPTILAMFLNAAIDQQLDVHVRRHGRAADAQEATAIRARTLATVRGTVQADILKEDQGRNTCIFSTEFSLRLMGDVAEWFGAHGVRNFYPASISGYHLAEAGANPISQLAMTLANGFTFVEAWLARGMAIDDFAPGLSFFFSNGMDPEYAVLGRVARRIWAVAMKERYGANERSQKLKYHVQTSGRSLHAQEVAFNDIRTTLQALIAIYDHCNTLHTNAHDEAVTTPTEESVRRAMAIQRILHREWGGAMNENPNQGAFIVDELTELVEEAVLAEFERLSERGGVLGAMETGYQRGRIQDESLLYESRKHSGELPVVGVNTFVDSHAGSGAPTLRLARSTEAEKESQLSRLADFHARHAEAAPAMLRRLQQAAIEGRNVFDVLMDAVRVCSLGQITAALFEVGGEYRRSM